jgi:tyrosine-protein kinase Etk/Wzc
VEGHPVSQSPQSGNAVVSYLSIMAGFRKLVIWIMLVSTVSTAIYSLVMDKTFESRAVIMPPAGGGNAMMGMLSSLPMAGMLADLGGLGMSGDGTYFVTILNSRMVLEEAIERFDLRSRYEQEDVEIEEVLEEAAEMIFASFNMETGMIELAARDEEPQVALAIAEWQIERLEEINRELNTRQASNNRTFIEGEVRRLRFELDSLESAMLNFQQESRLVEPEQQARVILEEYAAIKGQEALKELELELARQNFGKGHPEILRLERELASIREMRRETYESGDSELFIAINKLPTASMEFLRHKRELEIANQKLLFMLPQLESAKIEEARDVPVLKVLDPPRLAEKRIKPRRTIMVLVAGIVAWIVASVVVLFKHRLETDEEFAADMNGLADRLRGRE